MAEEVNPELERFRNQWREEVTARTKTASTRDVPKPQAVARRNSKPSSSTIPLLPEKIVVGGREEDQDDYEAQGHHDLENRDHLYRLGEEGEGIHPSNAKLKEPRSALEHYEKAVERETEGSLGDSLKLYRKAYRLDAGVDKAYKNKHFPASSSASKPASSNPSNAAVTMPNPAHHSPDGPPKQKISELITSFATEIITGIPPLIESTLPPPCPIASIPSEILMEILLHTAIIDVSSFMRLAQVCKRLAYLTATEDQIWRRVCLGSEMGFPAMHYSFACTIEGDPLPPPEDEETVLGYLLSLAITESKSSEPSPIDFHFPLASTYPTYKHMFQHRPRIRFNGCYISTVNYVRPGASSPTQISWNTPVHIVTYYRYLRFFRDGTCISLLTTSEPGDVVHYLTKEHLHAHHAPGSTLPIAVMKTAVGGRWHLSPPSTSSDPLSSSSQPPPNPTGTPIPSLTKSPNPSNYNPLSPSSRTKPLCSTEDTEGNLTIETPGADPKYTYTLHLALRSTRTVAIKNNKLAWRGFWSYNRLTDDWAEFRLRNDRPFVWSRVRRWGNE
ncbi:MAG: hypothetical protein MMC33_010672 [Icmadophila ericetorum]|nr:hypothetical protein [Icmadophila ericetorum]